MWKQLRIVDSAVHFCYGKSCKPTHSVSSIVSAKSIVQLAEQEQLFVFLQLVRSAGLEEAFENFSEYTVFAPSESAMYGEFIKCHSPASTITYV